MNPKSISLLSTLANFSLGVSKLIFGFLISSMALIADGIHSSLDVLSSFVVFLGLKVAQKPSDEEHPYGHGRAESIAGFVVAIILGITGVWILYEAIMRFFGEQVIKLSIGAIIVVVISIIINEISARIKFYYGGKFKSLALVTDAEHDRADALSSVGVLIGLLLIRYFNLADAVIAFGIGVYILYEAFRVGKEITQTLLDVANKELEERIRKICSSHNIEIADLRTRQIGSSNLAEIKIKLPKNLKMDEVQKITETLESRLLNNISELKEIVIAVEAYDMTKIVILPRLGRKIGELKGFEKIGPKKLGDRMVIPLDRDDISPRLGVSEYLIIDRKDDKILRREKIKNPYFEQDSPHGTRFIKAVRADKVISYEVGANAKKTLESFGIAAEIIPPDKKLKDILGEIKN